MLVTLRPSVGHTLNHHERRLQFVSSLIIWDVHVNQPGFVLPSNRSEAREVSRVFCVSIFTCRGFVSPGVKSHLQYRAETPEIKPAARQTQSEGFELVSSFLTEYSSKYNINSFKLIFTST